MFASSNLKSAALKTGESPRIPTLKQCSDFPAISSDDIRRCSYFTHAIHSICWSMSEVVVARCHLAKLLELWTILYLIGENMRIAVYTTIYLFWVVKAIIRDLLISAPSIFILLNKFSTVYIIDRTLRIDNILWI